eukprot:606336-Ditylum_brightwellii.AAC.1
MKKRLHKNGAIALLHKYIPIKWVVISENNTNMSDGKGNTNSIGASGGSPEKHPGGSPEHT